MVTETPDRPVNVGKFVNEHNCPVRAALIASFDYAAQHADDETCAVLSALLDQEITNEHAEALGLDARNDSNHFTSEIRLTVFG